MSQENVELVRRAFEAYARDGLDAVLLFVAPDAVFYPDPSWMEEREYHGPDGFAAFDKTQKDVFGEDFAIEVQEIRAVGARVLVLTETSQSRERATLSSRSWRWRSAVAHGSEVSSHFTTLQSREPDCRY